MSLEDQIACVERELAFRARVYPRWVADRKLLQATADLEMERMRAVLETLKQRSRLGWCAQCKRTIPMGVPVTCAESPCGMLVLARETT